MEDIYGSKIANMSQILILLLIIILSGSTVSSSLPFVVFAPFAGFLASKTQNFIYPAISQWITLVIVGIFFGNIF